MQHYVKYLTTVSYRTIYCYENKILLNTVVDSWRKLFKQLESTYAIVKATKRVPNNSERYNLKILRKRCAEKSYFDKAYNMRTTQYT